MASDLERIAQGLIDYLDANPRMAAELGAAAAECQQLAAQVAELAVMLPEAAAAAEYLQQAANDCGEAAQLSAGATVIGRNWAIEAVGASGPTAGDRPGSRDAAAGNKPESASPPQSPDAAVSPSQPEQIELNFGDLLVPDPGAAGDMAEPSTIELSTSDLEHRRILNHPPGNATIVVDGRFTYKTDERGRVISATAILDIVDVKHPRDVAAQRKLIGKLPGDHAGHIFARIFQGPLGSLNLTPMEGAKVNQSAYKTLENRWRQLIESGNEVEVFIELKYPGDSVRPDRIQVGYSQDGKIRWTTLRNTPRQQGGRDGGQRI